jgi:hypothetical protein
MDDDDRWENAARRAQGLTDNGLGHALRRYYTIYFPMGLVVLTTIGALVTDMVFGDEAEWPESLSGGIILAGIGALIGGLIYNARRITPVVAAGRAGVVMSLRDDERKQIRRQVLGKEQIVPEHLAVARGFAIQTRKALATQIVVLPMLPLVLIPQAFRMDTFIWWLTALAILTQVLASVIAVRQFLQAGRFLDTTAGQVNTG